MSSLRSSPPPARAVELRQWQLASGDELRGMRTGLLQALQLLDLVEKAVVDEVSDRILLAATELASNALRHGLPPAVVRLLRSDGHLIIEVADRDLESVPKLAEAHHAHTGGRGLHIVRSLSRELSWYATDLAKHVWASFPVPPPAPPTPAR
jgi:serine/threonine-protein kinase RsbW